MIGRALAAMDAVKAGAVLIDGAWIWRADVRASEAVARRVLVWLAQPAGDRHGYLRIGERT